jgi:hypothetical protein
MTNTELVTLPNMTCEEAQEKHNELKSLHNSMRLLLLEMRDRKGWLALGFSSWEDYGEKEWGFTRQHLNRLATSAYIQNLVEPIGSEEIPESQLRPLTSVPDDVKIEIWQQVKSEHEKITAKIVQDAVDDWKSKIKADDELLSVHESTNAIEQIVFNNPNTTVTAETEMTLAEFGTYVLGCSNAIAIAQKETSDIQCKLKSIQNQASKTQQVFATQITQIFMGMMIMALD